MPAGKETLRAPDPKFNRQIGAFAGKPYSVDGRLLSEAEHKEHLKKVLPQPEDLQRLHSITKEKNWVAGTQDTAR